MREARDDLDAVVKAYAADEPVVLVAHSLGGAYATTYASDHVARVQGLVLVDPTPFGFFEEQRRIIGEAQYHRSRTSALSRLTGMVRAEYEAMSHSLTTAWEARRALRGGTLLSAGRIENPDGVVGGRAKAAWLRLHQQLADALGLEHVVVADGGHRLQDASPGMVVAAIRRVALRQGSAP